MRSRTETLRDAPGTDRRRSDRIAFGESRRGQAYTLEAFIAGALVLGALYVAVQGAALTPLSASNTDYQIQHQERIHATDLLAVSEDTGALREALLHYDPEEETFIDAPSDREDYVAPNTDLEFGELLHETFTDRRVAVNVELVWLDDTGELESQSYIDMGSPSDNAVTVSQTITLLADDVVEYESDGVTEEVTLRQIEDDSGLSFYVSEAGGDYEYGYRVVNVRLTVWRI